MFETLNTVLKNLEKNIAARGKGERAVLLALALIILVGGGYIAVIEPALLRIDVARAEKLQAESQLSALQASFASMLELREQDPNETSRARLMALTREQERIDAEIAGLASDLISPVAMTELLISMLDKQEGLSLVSFENFPAIPIRLNPEAGASLGSEDQESIELASMLYQHNLKIEFRGDFFSTYQYLRFLEEISASFFWDSLRFEQVEWPSASVVLEIHTLSTEEGFIGA